MAFLTNNSGNSVTTGDTFELNEEVKWLQIACKSQQVNYCWMSLVGVDVEILISLPASFRLVPEDPAGDSFVFRAVAHGLMNEAGANPIANNDTVVLDVCPLDYELTAGNMGANLYGY